MKEGKRDGSSGFWSAFFGDEVLTEESYVQGKENVYL